MTVSCRCRRQGVTHVSGVVHGGELTSCRIRGMRAQVAEMGKPRTVLDSMPVKERIRDEGAQGVVGWSLRLRSECCDVVRERPVTQALEPIEPGSLRLGHPQTRLESRQDARVVLKPRVCVALCAAGINPLIGVAEEHRCPPHPTSESRHVVKPVIEGCAVAHHPMVRLVHPGVERGPSGRAGRCLRVVPGEVDAHRPEPVEGWCGHQRMLHHVGAELVQRDEQDVHVVAFPIVARTEVLKRAMAARTSPESPPNRM